MQSRQNINYYIIILVVSIDPKNGFVFYSKIYLVLPLDLPFVFKVSRDQPV